MEVADGRAGPDLHFLHVYDIRVPIHTISERVDRGGGDTGIRGAGDGGKGGGVKGVEVAGAGEEGRGTGVEGEGVGTFWGRGYTKICCILPIFMYFNAIAGFQKYIIDVLK